MKRIALPTIVVLVALVSLAFVQSDASEAEALILKVESTTSDAAVFFEATIGGDSPADVRRIVRQATPYEISADANNFHGLFHQLDGRGELRVTLSTDDGMVQATGPISIVQKRGAEMFATGL